ncbi:MAG TPA: hypothetical protein VFT57_14675 [Gemmatimonadaceae bacterium]|nr:hypothetical protein [Gemmatimonadaceae bacterium]
MVARDAHAAGDGGRARARVGVWLRGAAAIVALAVYAPRAAGQASFDYTFEMPGQPALQDIHAVVHMDSTGKLDATIDYENRDDLSPFCGGIVIGAYTAEGTLLQVFTTPIRCTPAMGANGKNPGQPWKRHFTWSASLREDYVPRASIIDVRAVATGDVKVITDEEARKALEQRTSVVSTF